MVLRNISELMDIRKLALIFIAVLAIARLRANDSAAEIGAGGIVLTQSAGIVMEQEDLLITTRLIRVEYRFRNVTDEPITTRVAFPIPEVPDPEHPQLGDPEEPGPVENPLNFKLVVDGQSRDYQTEVRPNGQKLRVTHHWLQTFLPGREIHVLHEYRPGLGSHFLPQKSDFQDSLYSPTETWDKAKASYRRAYCFDLRKARNSERHVYHGGVLRYILSTGANWRGPIGRFKLTIRLDRNDVRLSTCFNGLKRVAAKEYQFEATAYEPISDLTLLFISDLSASMRASKKGQ